MEDRSPFSPPTKGIKTTSSLQHGERKMYKHVSCGLFDNYFGLELSTFLFFTSYIFFIIFYHLFFSNY